MPKKKKKKRRSNTRTISLEFKDVGREEETVEYERLQRLILRKKTSRLRARVRFGQQLDRIPHLFTHTYI